MSFMTERSFQEEIENIVKQFHITHMEAVIQFCGDHDLDPEDIVSFVSSNLRDKIRQDAMDDGLIKKTAQLPI